MAQAPGLFGTDEALFSPRGNVDRLRNLGPGIGRQMGITSSAGLFEAFISEVADAGSGGREWPYTGQRRRLAIPGGMAFVRVRAGV